MVDVQWNDHDADSYNLQDVHQYRGHCNDRQKPSSGSVFFFNAAKVESERNVELQLSLEEFYVLDDTTTSP